MPITLTVRAEAGGSEPSLTLDAPRVVIGRGASCDVRLPDPSVSQRHAVVSAQGAEYQIIDESSTNGTFVGGVRLSPKAPRALRNGDMLRVGRVWLEVRVDQSAPTPDLALATRDLALALVQNAMAAQGNDTVPKVTIVEGADMGTILPLADEGRVYVVGRGETCDLPLADADASREHVQIVRRGSLVLVRDLRSKNGSMMGEQPIPTGRDAPWKSSAMVRVGATVLALDEPVAAALGDLESAADEKMAAGETPEPPKSAEPPPRSARGAEAPIARVDKSLVTVSTRARAPRIKMADVAIIGSALAIIALSIAALVWVLK
ncbi:MAG TPA: FHA domain-containing protein [Polyangiaceae bacterium]|jgi:pSer/pThr/pTyr-binding forkhead associated (FHA) protein|nr:FHA domain-containing protein [Polyangiaceae bacterium]